MAKEKKWIAEAVSKNPGKLREKLGAKEGEPIPKAKIEKAEHSKSPKLRKEAALAATLRRIKKGKSK